MDSAGIRSLNILLACTVHRTYGMCMRMCVQFHDQMARPATFHPFSFPLQIIPTSAYLLLVVVVVYVHYYIYNYVPALSTPCATAMYVMCMDGIDTDSNRARSDELLKRETSARSLTILVFFCICVYVNQPLCLICIYRSHGRKHSSQALFGQLNAW